MSIVWKRHASVVLALLSAVSLSSCYTIIRHPATDDRSDKDDFSRCNECHTDYMVDHPTYPYYPDPWWDYYIMPWWYDEVIVVTDDGAEIPGRRFIHDREIRYRDRSIGDRTIAPYEIHPQATESAGETTDDDADDRVRVKEQREERQSRDRQETIRDRDTTKRDTREDRDKSAKERREPKKEKDKDKDGSRDDLHNSVHQQRM